MSGFLPDWLSLREPLDHTARSEMVLSAVGHYFLNDARLNITDIGTGTGSTVRALRPYFEQPVSWHLIDNDPVLLNHAKNTLGTDRARISLADLSESLDCLFDEPASLITTSAFLDLVSESWLQNFVHEITARKIPFYAALTYDGRAECSPKHDLDDEILKAFNRHQLTDKGFGPALGPNAASAAVRTFKEAGYQIVEDRSDWNCGANHPEFQNMLLQGWYQAACEISPQKSVEFHTWLDFRLEKIAAGGNHTIVGHLDFIAIPPSD